MKIKEIYEKFDRIGCLSFATVNENGEPESRIAHLRAYDDNGIYFMTMLTKDFYKHMKANGKISICGLCAKTEVEHDENGNPIFESGYAIRMTGNVVEVPMEEIKAKNNPMFDFCVRDQKNIMQWLFFVSKMATVIFSITILKKLLEKIGLKENIFHLVKRMQNTKDC